MLKVVSEARNRALRATKNRRDFGAAVYEVRWHDSQARAGNPVSVALLA